MRRGEIRKLFVVISNDEVDPRQKPVPAAWADAIAGWTAAMRSAGRSPNTIATRTDHLRRCGRIMNRSPWAVTTGDLIAWTGARPWSREYRRSVRASLTGFYRWAIAMGLTADSPADGLPPVEPATPAARPAPDRIYRDALAHADARTCLILRLAGEVGLRRAEIAQIHSRDLGEDLLGDTLRVHGKGEKIRTVPLPRHIGLELRRIQGFAFPGRSDGHLSARHVGVLGSRALPDRWTLHTLRHRFATKAYSAERDLLSVQGLLGHTSPTTTQRYIEPPGDAMRRAMEAAS